MGRFVGRQMMQTVPVLFIVTVVAFAVTMLLPGDPALAILGVERARDAEAYQSLRRELGLDQPLPLQYVSWLGRLAHGDFGESVINNQPVIDGLRQRLPITIELGVLSMLFSVVVAVPFGIYAALRRDTIADLIASIVALAGVAMPSFWLGILLIYLFTLDWGLFQASGYVSFRDDPVDHLKHLVMPVFVLSVDSIGGLQRQVRSALLEVIGQDYIRTARAKGLAPNAVVWTHALRNALIPVATIIGLRVARLLGGAAVVETVFAIPGVGRLAVESIFNRDFPVIQAIVLVMALAVLLSNLLTDLAYGLLDPRIRCG
ncbi:MAG: ABC transporter permease [Thermomicrobiales bacterium]